MCLIVGDLGGIIDLSIVGCTAEDDDDDDDDDDGSVKR